jgi:hypothetical protein
MCAVINCFYSFVYPPWVGLGLVERVVDPEGPRRIPGTRTIEEL